MNSTAKNMKTLQALLYLAAIACVLGRDCYTFNIHRAPQNYPILDSMVEYGAKYDPHSDRFNFYANNIFYTGNVRNFIRCNSLEPNTNQIVETIFDSGSTGIDIGPIGRNVETKPPYVTSERYKFVLFDDASGCTRANYSFYATPTELTNEKLGCIKTEPQPDGTNLITVIQRYTIAPKESMPQVTKYIWSNSYEIPFEWQVGIKMTDIKSRDAIMSLATVNRKVDLATKQPFTQVDVRVSERVILENTTLSYPEDKWEMTYNASRIQLLTMQLRNDVPVDKLSKTRLRTKSQACIDPSPYTSSSGYTKYDCLNGTADYLIDWTLFFQVETPQGLYPVISPKATLLTAPDSQRSKMSSDPTPVFIGGSEFWIAWVSQELEALFYHVKRATLTLLYSDGSSAGLIEGLDYQLFTNVTDLPPDLDSHVRNTDKGIAVFQVHPNERTETFFVSLDGSIIVDVELHNGGVSYKINLRDDAFVERIGTSMRLKPKQQPSHIAVIVGSVLGATILFVALAIGIIVAYRKYVSVEKSEKKHLLSAPAKSIV